MTQPIAVRTGILYSVASPADSSAIAALLAGAFIQSDPLARGAGLTAAELEEFFSFLAAHVLGQGLSIVAKSMESEELAGTLLVEDSTTPPPAAMENLNPQFGPIFDLLGRLDAEYTQGRVRQPGESAHLYLLGVAEPYAGQGIAQRLLTCSLTIAAQRGYRVAVAEATSRTSQHIFRKLGFAERVKASYRDHRYEGQAHFASFAEEGGPILMDRILI